jgi:hypothetical protein
MKTEIKTPVLVGVMVVLVGGLIVFAMKYFSGVGSLDHGQIAYTPGVPPWGEKDPAKKEAYRKMGLELRDNTPQTAGHGPRTPAQVSPSSQAANQ